MQTHPRFNMLTRREHGTVEKRGSTAQTLPKPGATPLGSLATVSHAADALLDGRGVDN